jgi:hypothetical protein
MKSLMVCLTLLASVAVWAAPNVCTDKGPLHLICGLHNPEDLEPLPDGSHLLVSELNLTVAATGMKWGPGELSRLNVTDGRIEKLYPPRGKATKAGTNVWGDPSCPGEIGAALSPHGISLSRRADSRWQLLVVNHGGRESVEMFELVGGKRLEWRGCAVAPTGSMMNDVAALPDGGFVVTNMIDASRPEIAANFRDYARRGENTGFVWSWSAATGYKAVPGSEGVMPNGILADKEGRYFYYAVMGPASEVRKVELATGHHVGATKVVNPDNLSWDGHRLLAAGVDSVLDSSGCKAGSDQCLMPSHVVAIDPDTLAADTIFTQDGSLQGSVSVAVHMGRRLYIGAFSGNRILSIPLPK